MEKKFTHITIDGVEHQIVRYGGGDVVVDHPSLPGQPCARHLLSESELNNLFGGASIRTGGHVYSRVKISY